MANMQPNVFRIIAYTAAASLVAVFTANARPLDYAEVSLLVRAREPEAAIIGETSRRKLARPLTPQQESTLKTQGASDRLLTALRDPKMVSANTESRDSSPRISDGEGRAERSASRGDWPGAETFRVFNVAAGHSINLSQWGGPDYEFVFHVLRYAGEDIVEAALVDPTRTFTQVVTYHGEGQITGGTTRSFYSSPRFTPYLGGDLKDETIQGGNYASTISSDTWRRVSIDMRNPVFLRGVPYTLYPVYSAGGVSLYYVNKTRDTVTLAVSYQR